MALPMTSFNGFLVDANDAVITNALVTVTDAVDDLAVFFADAAGVIPLPNPIAIDSGSRLTFYIDAGVYSIDVMDLTDDSHQVYALTVAEESYTGLALYENVIRNSDGTPAAGGALNVMLANGSLPVLYVDALGTIAAPNPVYANALGEVSFYLQKGVYNFYLTTMRGNTNFLNVLVPPQGVSTGGGSSNEFENYTDNNFWSARPDHIGTDYEYLWIPGSDDWRLAGDTNDETPAVGLVVRVSGGNAGWQVGFRPTHITVTANSGASAGAGEDSDIETSIRLISSTDTIAVLLFPFSGASNQSITVDRALDWSTGDIAGLEVDLGGLWDYTVGPYIENIDFYTIVLPPWAAQWQSRYSVPFSSPEDYAWNNPTSDYRREVDQSGHSGSGEGLQAVGAWRDGFRPTHINLTVNSGDNEGNSGYLTGTVFEIRAVGGALLGSLAVNWDSYSQDKIVSIPLTFASAASAHDIHQIRISTFLYTYGPIFKNITFTGG